MTRSKLGRNRGEGGVEGVEGGGKEGGKEQGDNSPPSSNHRCWLKTEWQYWAEPEIVATVTCWPNVSRNRKIKMSQGITHRRVPFITTSRVPWKKNPQLDSALSSRVNLRIRPITMELTNIKGNRQSGTYDVQQVWRVASTMLLRHQLKSIGKWSIRVLPGRCVDIHPSSQPL